MPAKNQTGCIRFCVSVPVLSVQMTVAEPMVSDATSFRTRQFSRAMRIMFIARLTVTIIGSPSGTATTMIVTAMINELRTLCMRISESA